MMQLIKIVLVLGLVGFAYSWWTDRPAQNATQVTTSSPHGFVPVPMPSGTSRNTVVIFAPQNCPSDAAQRADALSSRLAALGVPSVRSSSFNLTITDPDEEQKAGLQRLNTVMNGTIPIVLINGMGKANPSADEVAAEYRRTRG